METPLYSLYFILPISLSHVKHPFLSLIIIVRTTNVKVTASFLVKVVQSRKRFFFLLNNICLARLQTKEPQFRSLIYYYYALQAVIKVVHFEGRISNMKCQMFGKHLVIYLSTIDFVYFILINMKNTVYYVL